MIKEKDIKPIPKYILKMIKSKDKKSYTAQDGNRRFYAYLAKFGGELVKVIVAVKNDKKKGGLCKQVVIHCVNSPLCLVKDIQHFYIGGYAVGWFDQGLQKYPRWYETTNWVNEYDKYYDPYAPILNKEYALKFDKYKYSVADRYPYCNLFKYLRLYEEYPQAEYLVKMNLSYLATSKVILRKIGKDKNFRKWLIQNRAELATKPHFIYVITRAYKENCSLSYAQTYEELKKSYKNNDAAKEIGKLFCEPKRFFDYLIRQNANISTYCDYYKACKYLQLDMADTKNLVPIDFKRWHDIRIDEYHTAKALQDEKERKELYAKFASVAEKYLPLQQNKDNAFIVVIAKSPQDLIKEGDTLHHCVGRMNYDQRFIREESLIFFVRDKVTPDAPFITMEYSLLQKKILQCYGDHNHKPSEQVQEYINKKWLPFANRQLKKIQSAA